MYFKKLLTLRPPVKLWWLTFTLILALLLPKSAEAEDWKGWPSRGHAKVVFFTREEGGRLVAVDPKGHEYSNLDLIQIEEGLPEESGNAGKLRIRGYSSVTVNLIANGKTEKLRFDGIDIECHGVAIELNATPYRENIAELLRGSWQGISKMVWEEADQKGPMGFSEKICWDIQPGVLTKDYEFHSASFPNIWKVKFSQITPQTVQRAVNEASEDKSYHPHLRGYEREMEVWTTDLYLPLHGCKVEIFQAEGWNEFPQFWNQKKVKVIWRNPSKLFGGPQEAE